MLFQPQLGDSKVFLSDYFHIEDPLLPTQLAKFLYEPLCTIWYHLYNFKNLKNTHEGVVEFQASPCNFGKINTPPQVFFTFFKMYKWY